MGQTVEKEKIEKEEIEKGPQNILGEELPYSPNPVNDLTKLPENEEYFEEEGLVKSPLVLSFGEKMVFNAQKDTPDFHTMKNYGKLPINVIHHLLLYHQSIDLVHLFQTCKLFYEVSCTNLFWKVYYSNYYGIEKKFESKVDLNWKKQFFRRYANTEFAEEKFLRKYRIETFEVQKKKVDFNFGIIGAPGIGKSAYLQRFESNKFCDSKSSRKTKTFFKVFDKGFKEEHKDDPIMSKSMVENYRTFRLAIVSTRNFANASKLCDGYLLCFDVGNSKSFEKLQEILDLQRKHSPLFTSTRTRWNRLNAVVVGLQCDQEREKRQIRKREVVEFVKKNKLKGYVETSSKNGCNIHLPVGVLFERIKKIHSSNSYDSMVLERELGEDDDDDIRLEYDLLELLRPEFVRDLSSFDNDRMMCK